MTCFILRIILCLSWTLPKSTSDTTLTIVAIFDLHFESGVSPGSNCSKINPDALGFLTLVEYVVQKENTISSVDDNVTISLHVINTCNSEEFTLQQLSDLFCGLQNSNKRDDSNLHLVGIISHTSNEITEKVQSLAALFHIPLVNVNYRVEKGPDSSVDHYYLSKRSRVRNIAPSREFIAYSITSFLKSMDVPYIQAVYSDTPYHREFLEILNQQTSLRDCCVVTQFKISQNFPISLLNTRIDGLVRERKFSPTTVMLTTHEDFIYFFEKYSARKMVQFGPLFVGLKLPSDNFLLRYSPWLIGSVYFDAMTPIATETIDFQSFMNNISSGQSSSVTCNLLVNQTCADFYRSASAILVDVTSSYIETAIRLFISITVSMRPGQTSCMREDSCIQRKLYERITNPNQCPEGGECVVGTISDSSVFDIYSMPFNRRLVHVGKVSGLIVDITWPPFSHLDKYWEILNKVRLGFRSECRVKVKNKYGLLNVDSADAYVIGVLHNHRQKLTPSGCDEGRVHVEHTLRSEAVLYAVDQINKRTDLLPNITLGAVIIDSCYITDKIIQQVVDIVTGHVKVKNGYGLLSLPIGIVGPSSSARTSIVAPTIQSLNLPIVSFSASSPLLSDKFSYPLFFRPIASDVKQAFAMIQLLKLHGWTYFGCVHSSTAYGTYGIREVIKQAELNGMKVAYQVSIDVSFYRDKEGMDYVFDNFIAHRMDTVKVVVAFLETLHAAEILKAAARHNVKGIVWVGSDSFTDSDTAAESEYAAGSIGVVFHTGNIQDFGRHVDSINARKHPENPFYVDLVESKLNCYILEENRLKYPGPCPQIANLTYSDISSGGESSPTIDCVLSLAHGLDFLLKRHRCADGKLCSDVKNNINTLPAVMTEVIFQGSSRETVMFDSKGDGVDRYDFINLRPSRDGSKNNDYIKFATWDSGRFYFSAVPIAVSTEGRIIPVSRINATCPDHNCHTTCSDVVDMEYAYVHGKLMIHVFLPLHYYDATIGTCSSKIDHAGFEAALSALWAIQTINSENNPLSSLELGMAIYDTCSQPTRATKLSQEVVKSTFLVSKPPDIPHKVKIIGLMGSTHDEETLGVANDRYLRGTSTKVPLISMTSSILPKELADDETFFRTVPPTDAEIRLIIKLLQILGWDYVHLVYTASQSQNANVRRFSDDATKEGVCVATMTALDSSWEGLHKYTEAIEHMINVTGATAVVLMTDETTTKKLLTAAQSVNAHGKLFWVATQSWQQRPNWLKPLQDIAIGALTIVPNRTINSDFGQYFNSLTIVNGSDITWFTEYWQSYFDCNLAQGNMYEQTCTANLKLNSTGGYDQAWEAPAVINAVYAYAHAVDAIAQKCKTGEIRCNSTLANSFTHKTLTDELQHVQFTPPGGINFNFKDRSGEASFDVYNMQPHRGTYRFTQVGSYSHGQLFLNMHHTGMYRNGQRLIPKSKCPGQCKVCLTDLFLAQYDAKVTKLTEAGAPLLHSLNRAVGIVIVSILTLGIGFTTLLVFYLIKLTASRKIFVELSVDASVTLIAGVVLLYLSNITFLFSATNITCGVRRICLGLAYCLCMSAQLVDVARLAVVSQIKTKVKPKHILQAKRAHIFIPVLLAGQIVPTVFWLFLQPSGTLISVPLPQDVASLDEVQATWKCKIERYELVCSLVYDGILMLHSLLLAIINHGVTIGYNARPAHSVIFSTVTSICIWSIWIPFYLLYEEENDAYLAIVSVAISLDGTLMLGINFMPKIIILIGHADDRTWKDVANVLKRKKICQQFTSYWTDRQRNEPEPGASNETSSLSRNPRPSNVNAVTYLSDKSRNESPKKGSESELSLTVAKKAAKRPSTTSPRQIRFMVDKKKDAIDEGSTSSASSYC